MVGNLTKQQLLISLHLQHPAQAATVCAKFHQGFQERTWHQNIRISELLEIVQKPMLVGNDLGCYVMFFFFGLPHIL